ncbi:helix-turn-helix domain-containing protein [Streptomyces sp. NBC_01341]|uniref:helix-turn-helix domain-containing protein n=1 Tax=Streptomyces sp. NBC_01341 TaxID=2903831 RepID=UPI002E1033E6|nr:helix-turn-helix domain-containing protein [Streptomyces sp. NBC_01341]
MDEWISQRLDGMGVVGPEKEGLVQATREEFKRSYQDLLDELLTQARAVVAERQPPPPEAALLHTAGDLGTAGIANEQTVRETDESGPLGRRLEPRGPRVRDRPGLRQAVSDVVAARHDARGDQEMSGSAVQSPHEMSEQECLVLLHSLRDNLFPQGVAPARTVDDAVLDGRTQEGPLALGPGWQSVASFDHVAEALARTGPGAAAFVLARRLSGKGHAFAAYALPPAAGSGGSQGEAPRTEVVWIDLTARDGHRLTAVPPVMAPVETRAVVVDSSARVVADALPEHTESASGRALVDGAGSHQYGVPNRTGRTAVPYGGGGAWIPPVHSVHGYPGQGMYPAVQGGIANAGFVHGYPGMQPAVLPTQPLRDPALTAHLARQSGTPPQWLSTQYPRNPDGTLSRAAVQAYLAISLATLQESLRRNQDDSGVTVDPGLSDHHVRTLMTPGLWGKYPEIENYLLRHDMGSNEDGNSAQADLLRVEETVGRTRVTFIYDPDDRTVQLRMGAVRRAMAIMAASGFPDLRETVQFYLPLYTRGINVTATRGVAGPVLHVTEESHEGGQAFDGLAEFSAPNNIVVSSELRPLSAPNEEVPYAFDDVMEERGVAAVVHELIHFWHYQFNQNKYIDLYHADLRVPQEVSAISGVSLYAEENPHEFVAEFGASMVFGRQYPDAQFQLLMNTYRDLGGPIPAGAASGFDRIPLDEAKVHYLVPAVANLLRNRGVRLAVTPQSIAHAHGRLSPYAASLRLDDRASALADLLQSGATSPSGIRIVGGSGRPLTLREAVDHVSEHLDIEAPPPSLDVIRDLVQGRADWQGTGEQLHDLVVRLSGGRATGGATVHDFYRDLLGQLLPRMTSRSGVHVRAYEDIARRIRDDHDVEMNEGRLVVDDYIGTSGLEPCLAVGLTGTYAGRRYNAVYHWPPATETPEDVFTQLAEMFAPHRIQPGQLENLQYFVLGGAPNSVHGQVELLEYMVDRHMTNTVVQLTNDPSQIDMGKIVYVDPRGRIYLGMSRDFSTTVFTAHTDEPMRRGLELALADARHAGASEDKVERLEAALASWPSADAPAGGQRDRVPGTHPDAIGTTGPTPGRKAPAGPRSRQATAGTSKTTSAEPDALREEPPRDVAAAGTSAGQRARNTRSDATGRKAPVGPRSRQATAGTDAHTQDTAPRESPQIEERPAPGPYPTSAPFGPRFRDQDGIRADVLAAAVHALQRRGRTTRPAGNRTASAVSVSSAPHTQVATDGRSQASTFGNTAPTGVGHLSPQAPRASAVTSDAEPVPQAAPDTAWPKAVMDTTAQHTAAYPVTPEQAELLESLQRTPVSVPDDGDCFLSALLVTVHYAYTPQQLADVAPAFPRHTSTDPVGELRSAVAAAFARPEVWEHVGFFFDNGTEGEAALLPGSRLHRHVVAKLGRRKQWDGEFGDVLPQVIHVLLAAEGHALDFGIVDYSDGRRTAMPSATSTNVLVLAKHPEGRATHYYATRPVDARPYQDLIRHYTALSGEAGRTRGPQQGHAPFVGMANTDDGMVNGLRETLRARIEDAAGGMLTGDAARDDDRFAGPHLSPGPVSEFRRAVNGHLSRLNRPGLSIGLEEAAEYLREADGPDRTRPTGLAWKTAGRIAHQGKPLGLPGGAPSRQDRFQSSSSLFGGSPVPGPSRHTTPFPGLALPGTGRRALAAHAGSSPATQQHPQTEIQPSAPGTAVGPSHRPTPFDVDTRLPAYVSPQAAQVLGDLVNHTWHGPLPQAFSFERSGLPQLPESVVDGTLGIAAQDRNATYGRVFEHLRTTHGIASLSRHDILFLHQRHLLLQMPRVHASSGEPAHAQRTALSVFPPFAVRRSIREQTRKSQKYVADLVGVAHSSLHTWETTDILPRHADIETKYLAVLYVFADASRHQEEWYVSAARDARVQEAVGHLLPMEHPSPAETVRTAREPLGILPGQHGVRKSIRERAEKSKQYVADFVGVPLSYVSRWESGTKPSADSAKKYAAVLYVNAEASRHGEDWYRAAADDPEVQEEVRRFLSWSNARAPETSYVGVAEDLSRILPDPAIRRRIRNSRNKTAKYFGSLAGVSDQSILRYEEGRIPRQSNIAKQYAAVLYMYAGADEHGKDWYRAAADDPQVQAEVRRLTGTPIGRSPAHSRGPAEVPPMAGSSSAQPMMYQDEVDAQFAAWGLHTGGTRSLGSQSSYPSDSAYQQYPYVGRADTSDAMRWGLERALAEARTSASPDRAHISELKKALTRWYKGATAAIQVDSPPGTTAQTPNVPAPGVRRDADTERSEAGHSREGSDGVVPGPGSEFRGALNAEPAGLDVRPGDARTDARTKGTDTGRTAEPPTYAGTPDAKAGRDGYAVSAPQKSPADMTGAASAQSPGPGLLAFLDAPRSTGAVSPRPGAETRGVTTSAQTEAPASREAVPGPEAGQAMDPGGASASKWLGDLLDRLKEEVRPAVRVWGRAAADHAGVLKNILTAPGSRSLVFGAAWDDPRWVLNMGGTVRWFTLDAQPVPTPDFADGLFASIDIDHHGQLTGPAQQTLHKSAARAQDWAKTGFCDLNLGVSLPTVIGWRTPKE